MTNSTLADFLSTEPEGTLESFASQYHTNLREVVQHLPNAILVSGTNFDSIWSQICTWGKVICLVHTEDVILEFFGDLPSGSHRHGYFNLRGKQGFSGHIKVENCCHIAFVERKFMKMDTASVLFLNEAGNAMLKIFVGRDEHNQLFSKQLNDFRTLSRSFGE
jgi:putative heme utilization carrier protein HutX